MPQDVILLYVKSIDERTARMETSITAAIKAHIEDDDIRYEKMDDRLKSLETSRVAARTGLTVLALGGTGGAAKLGFLDKIVSLFGGGT